MNPQLESVLRHLGAAIADGVDRAARDFGAPAAEFAAATQGGFAADLSHFGVLEFGGADATEFLQNQLSCDVRGLPANTSSYGSYCTPKGRMLAIFLLWQEQREQEVGAWRMLLPRTILPATAKRLGMFVLRSNVSISDVSDSLALVGAGGPAAVNAVGSVIGPVPTAPHAMYFAPAKGTVIALPGNRCLLALPAAAVATAWPALAAALKPVGAPVWDWTDIHNGIAFVWPQTQEQFVPQMTNLELIGGVNFKKGCYPGQEIVARTQYLGRLKRRLFLAHVGSDAAAGDELFSDDVQGQSNGMVASAAPAPGGGYDLLAVVQSTSAEHSRVHLQAASGPLLAFAPLPYAVS